MLEYVFFADEPRKRFQRLLDDHRIPWTLEAGDPETLVIVDDAAVDDTLADRFEAVYDELFTMEQALYDAKVAPSPEHHSATGVVVNLRDGRTVYADVPADLVNRMLAVISPAELGTLVDAIVSAVESPDPRGLCQRLPEGR